MKLCRISFLLIWFRIMNAQQMNDKVDTIYCTDSNTSYAIFKDRVELVDIGNPADYASQIEDNSVFVKSLKPNSPASTMLVKTGKDYYFSVLKYQEENKKFFYDFAAVENDKIKGNDKPTLVSMRELVEKKLSRVVAGRNELETMGFITTFIEAEVGVIRNDNQNTYLKIILKNKSSIPYRLDFISFQYYRHMKKGFAKKAKASGMEVFPVVSPVIPEISPYSCKPLGYAIPSFGLAGKGYLMISFRESSGDRVLTIKVKGAEIQKASVIENGN